MTLLKVSSSRPKNCIFPEPRAVSPEGKAATGSARPLPFHALCDPKCRRVTPRGRETGQRWTRGWRQAKHDGPPAPPARRPTARTARLSPAPPGRANHRRRFRGAGLTPRPPPAEEGGRKSGRRHLCEGWGDGGGAAVLKAVAAQLVRGSAPSRAVHRLCVTPKFELRPALLEHGRIHTAVRAGRVRGGLGALRAATAPRGRGGEGAW